VVGDLRQGLRRDTVPLAGESADMAADAQEQRLRAESLEEDPSLADYDLNSDEQEDRINGSAGTVEEQAGGDSDEDEDSMALEMKALTGDSE
jgi:hypothetical protein